MAAKIPQSVVEEMKNVMEQKFKKMGTNFDHVLTAYQNRQIASAKAVKDINVRMRWDMYWMMRAHLQTTVGFDTPLLLELNKYESNHIDTALRTIVSKFMEERVAV